MRRPGSLIRAEAEFFVDQVCSGQMTLDQARADIEINARTLAIWREWLEWESWPRAMLTASIRLRRQISEKFEALLRERVRETCRQLADAAEAVEMVEIQQPEQQVDETLVVAQEETNGSDPMHDLPSPA